MKKALVLSLVLGSALGVAQAGQVVWIEGDVTGNWTNSANWEGGVLPTAADDLIRVNGGHLIVDSPDAVLDRGENASLDGGSMMITNGGVLTVTRSFEAARHLPGATLTVDGGALIVGTTLYNGHYNDAASVIDVKNGGTITCQSFRGGDGSSAATNGSIIRMSGATSSITTTLGGANNVFNNGNSSFTNLFDMAGGTFTTAKRDYWAGTVDFEISGGLYDGNGDQFVMGSKPNSQVDMRISGGELNLAGTFYLCHAENASGTVSMTGGLLKMIGSGKDFNMTQALNANATVEISGGTFDLVRHLSMHSNNGGFPTFSVVGDEGTILIGDDLNAQHTNATLRFTPNASGISPIQVTDRANIAGCSLEVDLNNYGGGDMLVLVTTGPGKVSGSFGSTNIVGGTADLVEQYDLDGGGTNIAIVLNNILVNASYSVWTDAYELEGAEADFDADPDSDGLGNLGEYAFGGNPTNDQSQGQQPWLAGDLEYIYQLIDDPNVTAEVITETDLVNGGTTVEVTFVESGPGVAGFINYTNAVDTTVENVGFLSLELSYD